MEFKEIIRNGAGCCLTDGKSVQVKDHMGKVFVNCDMDKFLSLVPFINAMDDYKTGVRDSHGATPRSTGQGWAILILGIVRQDTSV